MKGVNSSRTGEGKSLNAFSDLAVPKKVKIPTFRALAMCSPCSPYTATEEPLYLQCHVAWRCVKCASVTSHMMNPDPSRAAGKRRINLNYRFISPCRLQYYCVLDGHVQEELWPTKLQKYCSTVFIHTHILTVNCQFRLLTTNNRKYYKAEISLHVMTICCTLVLFFVRTSAWQRLIIKAETCGTLNNKISLNTSVVFTV